MCRISASRGHWSKLHDFFTCLVCGRIGASGCQWFGTTYDDPFAFGIGKDSWQSSNGNGAMLCQQKTCNQLLYPRFSDVLFKDPVHGLFWKKWALPPPSNKARNTDQLKSIRVEDCSASRIEDKQAILAKIGAQDVISDWNLEMIWWLYSDVFRKKWHQDRFFLSKRMIRMVLEESKRWSKILCLGGRCWQTQERRHITYANTFYKLNLCLLQTWHLKGGGGTVQSPLLGLLKHINFWSRFSHSEPLESLEILTFECLISLHIETGGKKSTEVCNRSSWETEATAFVFKKCLVFTTKTFHKFGCCFAVSHSFTFQDGLPISYSSLIDCLTCVTARFAVGLAGCTEIAAEQQTFVWCGMFFFWVLILFHKMLIRFDLEIFEIWNMISAWQGNLGTELFKYDEIWQCMMYDCSMLLRELPKLVISCHLMVLIGWTKMDMSPCCLIASCQICHHSLHSSFLHWNPTIGILGILRYS